MVLLGNLFFMFHSNLLIFVFIKQVEKYIKLNDTNIVIPVPKLFNDVEKTKEMLVAIERVSELTDEY